MRDPSTYSPPVPGPPIQYRHSVAGRLTTPALLLGLIPLTIAAIVALTMGITGLSTADQTRRQAEQAALASATDTLAADAAGTAGAIDRFVVERLGDAADLARHRSLVASVAAPYDQLDTMAAWPTSLVEARLDAPADQLDASGETTRLLQAWLDDHPMFVSALVTDTNGYTVGSTVVDDFAHEERQWWQGAWRTGAELIPVQGPNDVAGTFEIAVRIDHPDTRRPLGVVRVAVDPAPIRAVADWGLDSTEGASAGAPAPTADSGRDRTVVTADTLLVAETASAHDPSRLGTVPEGAVASLLTDADEDASELVGGRATTADRYPVEPIGGDVAGLGLVVLTSQPTSTALAPLAGLEEAGGRAQSNVIALALILAGLAALTVLGALAGARYLARKIANPMLVLRDEANRLADTELPDLVTSLRSTDGSGELPAVDLIDLDCDGEVADLVDAFNRLRATTVELAAGQAIDHSKDLASVLINLGRRNHQLIGNQLQFIDELELTESDPDVLRNLFTLDQMATRMRRNADNLLVLAGERVTRMIERPLPIEDVLRAASSEVEDFARVQIARVERAVVQPAVVSDLTHLLAELVENATRFSPPESTVDIVGRWEEGGRYTISVIDTGPGLSRLELADANARIQHSTLGSEQPASQLGLYVVGRLAARHHIHARLVESVESGTTAKVTLSALCVSPLPEPSGIVIGSRLSATQALAQERPAAFPPPLRPITGRMPVVAGAGDSPANGSGGSEDGGRPGAEAGDDGGPEEAAVADESDGLPIPPFRARRSKRHEGQEEDEGRAQDAPAALVPAPPVHPSDPTPGRTNGHGNGTETNGATNGHSHNGATDGNSNGAETNGHNGATDGTVTSGNHTNDRHSNGGDTSTNGSNGDGDQVVATGEERAALVQERLSRFTAAVAAAKAATALDVGADGEGDPD